MTCCKSKESLPQWEGKVSSYSTCSSNFAASSPVLLKPHSQPFLETSWQKRRAEKWGPVYKWQKKFFKGKIYTSLPLLLRGTSPRWEPRCPFLIAVRKGVKATACCYPVRSNQEERVSLPLRLCISPLDMANFILKKPQSLQARHPTQIKSN